ncbi:RICIN domain-containing protein [Thiorhodospira sibirica]|uniref:RICIN domain-containing protein n=1 Tax=Thiorhodospira sibirica TaxID=154347 RepID=UPI00022C4025|nr:ricin-type beta-trefoil lectin domain protein [Thiorhodospira sibirica]
MKNTLFYSALAAMLVLASSAQAIKFNPDALRSMQEEGLKIANQLHTERPYRLGGQCLHLEGDLQNFPANVVLQPCNDSAHQRWRFDEHSRFRNQSGACMTVQGENAIAGACGEGDPFIWTLGTNGQMTHKASGQCLSAHGDASKPGTNVGIAACNGNGAQLWQP